ncbi:hypothetical protein EVAR_54568_1 [Eumeta japonica]|uniref:Uncharacterized protein n=1 Tax=Eumeta variegata TaxID=151549 RepID=A0A4C1YIQ8_EUMVA|nr:hypothetical protein EVAR_54568_1 [Eumeta japonica]
MKICGAPSHCKKARETDGPPTVALVYTSSQYDGPLCACLAPSSAASGARSIYSCSSMGARFVRDLGERPTIDFSYCANSANFSAVLGQSMCRSAVRPDDSAVSKSENNNLKLFRDAKNHPVPVLLPAPPTDRHVLPREFNFNQISIGDFDCVSTHRAWPSHLDEPMGLVLLLVSWCRTRRYERVHDTFSQSNFESKGSDHKSSTLARREVWVLLTFIVRNAIEVPEPAA